MPNMPTTDNKPVISQVAAQGSKRKKPTFECQSCSRKFATRSHLVRHSRVHTGERRYACDYPGCEMRCSRKDNLQQHYRTHLVVNPRRANAQSMLSMAAELDVEHRPKKPQVETSNIIASTSPVSPLTAADVQAAQRAALALPRAQQQVQLVTEFQPVPRSTSDYETDREREWSMSPPPLSNAYDYWYAHGCLPYPNAMSVSTSGSSGATSPEISNALELAPGRFVDSPTTYYPPSTTNSYSPYDHHRSSSRDEYVDRYPTSYPGPAEYGGVCTANFTRAQPNYEQQAHTPLQSQALQSQGRPATANPLQPNQSYSGVVPDTSYGIPPYHPDRSSSNSSSPYDNATTMQSSPNATSGFAPPPTTSSGDASQYGRSVLGATNDGSYHSLEDNNPASGNDRRNTRLSSVPGQQSSYSSASPYAASLFDHSHINNGSYPVDMAASYNGGRGMHEQYMPGNGSPVIQRSHSVVLPPIRLHDSVLPQQQQSPIRRHSESMAGLHHSHVMMMSPPSVANGAYGMNNWERVNVSDTRSHHPHGSMGLAR